MSYQSLAHNWVNQTRDEQREGNMSFITKRIFSWSTVIGQILESPEGGRVYVLNNTNYSSYTSRQQRHIYRAIDKDSVQFEYGSRIPRGQSWLVSDDWTKAGREIFDYQIDQAAMWEVYAGRAKSREKHDWHVERREDWFKHARRVAEVFGFEYEVDQDKFNEMKLAHAQRYENELGAQRQRARQLREAKKAAKIEEELFKANKQALLDNWREGKKPLYGWDIGTNLHRLPVALRIKPGAPDKVESSHGAIVKRSDVVRAYRFISARRAGWKANGEKFDISGFPLNLINEDGVAVGCHRISWEEIERFASTLGISGNKLPETEEVETATNP